MLEGLKKKVYDKSKIIFLICLSTFLLGIGFYNNQWKAVEQDWFMTHQQDTESLVVGRMAKSKQDGILSGGGLTGNVSGGHIQTGGVQNQYQAYYKNFNFENFSPYYSQIGFQGITCSLLDKITLFPPEKNISVLRFLNSYFFALILSIIVIWFYLEFGFISFITVLLSTIFSQWMTVFGRNLWWVMWAFYLPFLASLYNILINQKKTHPAIMITFAAILIKCLYNGYEYITTTILMMLTPYIYYWVVERWKPKLFFKKILTMGTTAIVSILSSTIILAFQISTVEGRLKAGFYHIFICSIGKRTHGDASNYPAIYASSLEASILDVMDKYLKGIIFNLNNIFGSSSDSLKINYLAVISLFFLVSCLLYLSNYGLTERLFRTMHESRRQLIAFSLALWFSFLAPVSWFVIFKGHSYIHTHMNYIVWHMPFTLLGFALLGAITYHFTFGLFEVLRHEFFRAKGDLLRI